VAEVKEEQQKEQPEPADEVALVAEVKEEEQLKEQPEPADQVTLVARGS
jgi:hypothetical protein